MMKTVINGKLNPELGLNIDDHLDLSHTDITKLPDNLTVGGSLYLEYTDITKLPDNLTVGGSLYLEGTKITNYPVVYDCGDLHRVIYLDLKDKSLIRIGCFIGTREEAIQAISKKYLDPSEYIAKVNECFDNA